MRTPAVYDLQTEKIAYPDGSRFSLGTDADVTAPVAEPWGNRGGVENIDRLLDGVEAHHATVAVSGDVARVRPVEETATIYVDASQVNGETTIRNGETLVLGSRKSDLWEGYRFQVFF